MCKQINFDQVLTGNKELKAWLEKYSGREISMATMHRLRKIYNIPYKVINSRVLKFRVRDVIKAVPGIIWGK